MSLTRPRRKPIFHRGKSPWPKPMIGLAVAAFALTAVLSFKAAEGGFEDLRPGARAVAADVAEAPTRSR